MPLLHRDPREKGSRDGGLGTGNRRGRFDRCGTAGRSGRDSWHTCYAIAWLEARHRLSDYMSDLQADEFTATRCRPAKGVRVPFGCVLVNLVETDSKLIA